MLKWIPIAFLCLFAAGCTTGITDPETGERVGASEVLNLRDNLITATRADAEAALALAEQADNPEWARCWSTVIVVLDGKGDNSSTPVAVIGPLSALQKASNIYRAVDDGLDPRVRADCAIVVMDILRFARRAVGRFAPVPVVGSVLRR